MVVCDLVYRGVDSNQLVWVLEDANWKIGEKGVYCWNPGIGAVRMIYIMYCKKYSCSFSCKLHYELGRCEIIQTLEAIKPTETTQSNIKELVFVFKWSSKISIKILATLLHVCLTEAETCTVYLYQAWWRYLRRQGCMILI